MGAVKCIGPSSLGLRFAQGRLLRMTVARGRIGTLALLPLISYIRMVKSLIQQ
jgi:hypothetical protein